MSFGGRWRGEPPECMLAIQDRVTSLTIDKKRRRNLVYVLVMKESFGSGKLTLRQAGFSICTRHIAKVACAHRQQKTAVLRHGGSFCLQ
jgi:hypothetical protein